MNNTPNFILLVIVSLFGVVGLGILGVIAIVNFLFGWGISYSFLNVFFCMLLLSLINNFMR